MFKLNNIFRKISHVVVKWSAVTDLDKSICHYSKLSKLNITAVKLYIFDFKKNLIN